MEDDDTVLEFALALNWNGLEPEGVALLVVLPNEKLCFGGSAFEVLLPNAKVEELELLADVVVVGAVNVFVLGAAPKVKIPLLEEESFFAESAKLKPVVAFGLLSLLPPKPNFGGSVVDPLFDVKLNDGVVVEIAEADVVVDGVDMPNVKDD